ncbi:MAG: adenosylcobinamide-GDP ribazoletransferase [Acidimicrobiia bacterium]|nr:adenosylcobinamide-GDP ribazoletransferase [Acidimicrobiia bacterium]
MRSLRLALAFLTRIPLTPTDPVAFPTPAIGVLFPVAGLVIGGLVGGVYWLTAEVLPTGPAAIVAVAFSVLITGGFHEDGLADTFDALGGGQDRESALRIFKDSRLGTFGVAAIVVSLLLRTALLGGLDATTGLLALMAAHVIGRATTAAAMGFATPATSGLGTSLMTGFTVAHSFGATAIGLGIGLALIGPAALIGLGLTILAAVALGRWATGKMGGVTGDVLGAIEQCGEVAVLAAVVATADLWSLPWWN